MVVNWVLVGWVMASRKRKEVIAHLVSAPRTPKHLSNVTGANIAQISAILSELSKRGVVECLTPDAKKGRIYSLTKLGVSVHSKILEMENQSE